ncbi:MAG: hypothetical protein IJT30_09705 [Muribaculaceae bacterium]|nr:hypothetical protein [Muribaculaceae bacterium]
MFFYGALDEVFDDYHFLTVAVVVPPGSEQAYRNAPGWRRCSRIAVRQSHISTALRALRSRLATSP